MFTTAITRIPAVNFAEGLTTASLGKPDYALALDLHAVYVRALEQCGLAVTTLPAEPRFPDSTFVEDAAVLVGDAAILSHPGAPSRMGEVEAIRPEIEARFEQVFSIVPPGTLDGGDICEAGDHYFIGVSHRTNPEGARQLGRILSSLGKTTSLVDIRGIPSILHLKSGIAWLGDQRLALIESLSGLPEFAGWQAMRVPSGEDYAANMVLINGRLLVAGGFPRTHEAVGRVGYPLLVLEMSEFQKMDGGLSCLSLRY